MNFEKADYHFEAITNSSTPLVQCPVFHFALVDQSKYSSSQNISTTTGARTYGFFNPTSAVKLILFDLRIINDSRPTTLIYH